MCFKESTQKRTNIIERLQSSRKERYATATWKFTLTLTVCVYTVPNTLCSEFVSLLVLSSLLFFSFSFVCVCFFKEYRYLRGTVYILMPFFSWRHESYLEDMYQEFGVINAVSYFVIMWGFLSKQILPNTWRDMRNKDPTSLLISFFNIAYFTILPGTGAPHSWIMWKFKRASTWKW